MRRWQVSRRAHATSVCGAPSRSFLMPRMFVYVTPSFVSAHVSLVSVCMASVRRTGNYYSVRCYRGEFRPFEAVQPGGPLTASCSKEGATRHPTHSRCPSSLRRHQDAAWTAHATAACRTARRQYMGGARVDVCRWPQHSAYRTTNKLQQRVSILHTSARTTGNYTPLV